MSEKVKQINYTEKDYLVVRVLKEAGKPLTNREINELAGQTIAAGTLGSAVTKGLIAVAGKTEVMRAVPRKVNAYTYLTDEPQKDPKGKEKVYSDMELAIIKALKEAEKPLALTEIAAALGLEKLAAGSISGIKKAGNIGVAAEKVTVIGYNPDEVNTYVYVMDVPVAAPVTAFGEQKKWTYFSKLLLTKRRKCAIIYI